MAQKRMIDKKISVSEQVADLPIQAQLIFTWAIPHADDLGMLPFSKRTLKATIIPLVEMSLEDFGFHLESIVKTGLMEVFEFNGKKFYRICTFLHNQTLKRDRQPSTILPFQFEEKPRDSWVKLTRELAAKGVSGIHLENIGIQLDTELKGTELKGTEEREKKPHASLSYLTAIPDEDLKELTTKFDCSTGQIKRKAEQMANYCKAKAKVYRNYRAFLENGLDKDFGRRPAPKKIEVVDRTPMTPAEKAHLEALKADIKAKWQLKKV